MSVMDKLINAMKFNDDDEDYEDEDYEDEDFYGDDKPAEKNERPSRSTPAIDEDEEEDIPAPAPRPRKRFGSAAPDRNESRSESGSVSRQVKKQYSEAGMEVCIIKPTSVNDAREVTDTLLSNSTVVLNLEGLDVEIAQRIIDFTSGSCYAVHGNVMKISHYIFVITPANVDVSGKLIQIRFTEKHMKSAPNNFLVRYIFGHLSMKRMPVDQNSQQKPVNKWM